MRNLFIIISFFISSNLFSQSNQSNEFDCVPPKDNRSITFADTLFMHHESGLHIYNRDSNSILISIISFWDTLYANNVVYLEEKQGVRMEFYYDTDESEIFSLTTKHNRIISCLQYKYNSKKLIEKIGIIAGKRVRILYEYDLQGKVSKESIFDL